jgi:hypothetical protein
MNRLERRGRIEDRTPSPETAKTEPHNHPRTKGGGDDERKPFKPGHAHLSFSIIPHNTFEVNPANCLTKNLNEIDSLRRIRI